MIDLHCHVLPGIDDGPRTIEGSLDIARSALAAGIGTLVATPHVNARTPNDPDTIASRVLEVNVRLREEGIAVEVLPGAEIAITTIDEVAPDMLQRLGLGGGRWLLIEPPFTPVALGIESAIHGLLEDGHRVVLAHPERCPAFGRDRPALERLARAGVLMSLTAGSLIGRFGSDVRRLALELAQEGLLHNVTSDAHDTDRRAPGIADELRRAGLGALTEWCAQAVPAAILSGSPIPPRPQDAQPQRRGLRGWLARS